MGHENALNICYRPKDIVRGRYCRTMQQKRKGILYCITMQMTLYNLLTAGPEDEVNVHVQSFFIY